MKKLLLVLLIVMSINSYGQENPDAYYGYHYGAGFLMGGSVGIMHKSPKVAFTSAVVTGIGIGLAKEIYDVKYYNHQFSNKDFVFTVLGSATSGLLVYYAKRHIHLKKFIKRRW